MIGSGARRVTDKMLLAGARALGDHSPALQDPTGSLLPRVKTIRDVALDIANAVGTKAQKEGLAPASEPDALRKKVKEKPVVPGIPNIRVSGVIGIKKVGRAKQSG